MRPAIVDAPPPRSPRRPYLLLVAATLVLAACGSDDDPTGPTRDETVAAGAMDTAPLARVAAIPVTAVLDLRARVTGFDQGEGTASVVFEGTTSEGQPLSGRGKMRFTAEVRPPGQDTLAVMTAELRFRGTLGSAGASLDVRGRGGLDLDGILIPRAGIVFLPITEFMGELVPR